MNLRIRITRSACDGLVYAICASGSWKPLLTFLSRAEAMEALS
jgi:hypothetical protein